MHSKSYWKKVTGPAFFAKLLVQKKTGSKKFFFFKIIFFSIHKTVLVVQLTFESWVSGFKNVKFMDKIVIFFLLKLAPKPCFLPIPGCNKQFCKYWQACHFFAIWLTMLISFLNNADILILTNFRIPNQFWKISFSMS